MPNESNLIGSGSVDLESGGKLPFRIYPKGILFYPPGVGNEGRPLFDLVDGNTSGSGHLVLTNLPANPEGAFHDASLKLESNELTITVSTDAGKPFGHIVNAHFQDLNLVFKQKKNSVLKVTGEVTLMLFGEKAIPLNAEIIEEAFVFLRNDSLEPIDIATVGALSLQELKISANYDRWKDLQVLYSLDEGQGKQIKDSSGSADVLDLTIKGPGSSTSWVEGGLAIGKGADIKSPQKAGPMVAAIWDANEFSVEVWLKPKKAKPGSPSTVLTLTTSHGGTFFSLGQHPEESSFFAAGLFFGKTPPLSMDRHHLVFSREKDGTERLFVDGVEQAQRKNAGNLKEMTPWDDPKYFLTLGNHPKGDQPWEGEIYQIGIYSRALTEENLLNKYYQFIELSGGLQISDAPPPFDKAFPATFSLFKDVATVTVNHEENLSVRPELHFEKLDLQWQQTAPKSWDLSGLIDARFWDNAVVMNAGASRSKERPLLVLSAGETVLQLDDWGALSFSGLKLKVSRSGDHVAWSLDTATDQPYFLLPTPGHRTLDAGVDFTLLDPELTLTADSLLVRGKWLNESIRLKTIHRNGDRLLKTLDAIQLALPFSLDLPDFYDPKTGAKVADSVHIDLENMNIRLDLEIGTNGFLSHVNSSFGWNESKNTRQELTLTPFRLYLPPPTRHALLAQVIEEAKKQANKLFAEQGKHAADYYLVTKNGKGLLYLSGSKIMPEEVQSELPALSGTNVDIKASPNIIRLHQSDGLATLAIDVKGRSQGDIDKAFDDFWNKITDAGPSLLPGASSLLRRRLAERLPQHYDRTLYYHYNWNEEENYLDLHPGMRLRVDFQNYQFTRASETRARNGHVGSGTAYYYLNSYTHQTNDGKIHQLLGFDSFLSQVQVDHMPLADDGAGGIVDLFRGPDSRKTHYRLFYPRQFQGLGPEQVATFLGSDDLAGLEGATPSLLNNGSVTPNGVISFYFRGKATVIPEIQIFISDNPVYVPVGTTIRQLVERQAGLPAPGLGEDLGAFLGVARPLRLLHEGPNSRPTYVFLNMETYSTFGDTSDLFDLPVIMGDRFYF